MAIRTPFWILLLFAVACHSSGAAEPESSEGDSGPPMCAGNLDCEAGGECVEGVCQPYDCGPACADECASNTECTAGEICEDGSCVAGVTVCSTTPRFDAQPLHPTIEGEVRAMDMTQTDADAALELVVATDAGLWLLDVEREPMLVSDDGASAIAFADIDGDGDHDLVALNIATEPALQSFRLSGGTFTLLQTIAGDLAGVDGGDITGDGAEDILVTRATRDGFELLAMFSEPETGTLADPALQIAGLDLPHVVADRLGSGDLADVVAHRDGTTCVWGGEQGINGDPFSVVDDIVPEPPSAGVLLAELDPADDEAKAKLDLVMVHPSTSTTTIMRASGLALSVVVPVVGFTSDAGDLNGDGAAEIFVGAVGTLAVVDSATAAKPCYSVFGVDHDARVLAVGDHDGDALLDIAFSDGVTTTLLFGRAR